MTSPLPGVPRYEANPQTIGYVQAGKWTLCLHCRNVFAGEHYCGAEWQVPEQHAAFDIDNIPLIWIEEIQARVASLRASPEPTTPKHYDSGSYGELPERIRHEIVGYEWDNMRRDEQREWLIARLDDALALRASPPTPTAEWQRPDGCPCLVIGPCTRQCSCVSPVLSGGCLRCARYGSPEQRRAKAERIDAALRSSSGATAEPTDTERLALEVAADLAEVDREWDRQAAQDDDDFTDPRGNGFQDWATMRQDLEYLIERAARVSPFVPDVWLADTRRHVLRIAAMCLAQLRGFAEGDTNG